MSRWCNCMSKSTARMRPRPRRTASAPARARSRQERASRGFSHRGDREMIFHRRPIIQRWAQDGLQLPRSSTEPHVIAVDGLGSLHSCTDVVKDTRSWRQAGGGELSHRLQVDRALSFKLRRFQVQVTPNTLRPKRRRQAEGEPRGARIRPSGASARMQCTS